MTMLEALLDAPALVKVLGSLALILIFKPLCRSLLAALLIGAVTLGFWSGHGPAGVAAIAGRQFLRLDNYMLLLVVAEVIWLSSQMAHTGLMDDLVAAVRARLPREGAMAVLPAVIGLLPMPGGALFSAPLVDSCDVDNSLEGITKAKTNYWFRHIWEYWWPLYPGVLLAMALAGLDVWHMVFTGLPLTIAMAGAGWFFLLRGLDPEHPDIQRPEHPDVHLMHLFAPIWVVVVVYATVRLGALGASNMTDAFGEVNKYAPMATGIIAAMLVLQRMRPVKQEDWREIIFSGRLARLILIVLAVRIYGAYISAPVTAGDGNLADLMRVELDAWGVPILVIMMVLPFVAGLTTGLAVGFVGASFPVLMSLVGGVDVAWQVKVAWVALAYGFGQVGMMLSPVHVCHIVTNEHFSTRLVHSIRGLIPPAVVVLVSAFALHLVYRWLLV
jgi:hypothetical protein